MSEKLERAENRILELEAPKEAPAKMPNHPTHLQNGADLGSQKLSDCQADSAGRGKSPEAAGSEAAGSAPFTELRLGRWDWSALLDPAAKIWREKGGG